MNDLHARPRRLLLLALMALIVALFAGCGRSGVRIGWAATTGLHSKRATYTYLNGQEYATIRAGAGETIAVDYKVEVAQGTLTIRIVDPDGEEIEEVELKEDGKGTLEFTAEQEGRYTIAITGSETKGSYKLEW